MPPCVLQHAPESIDMVNQLLFRHLEDRVVDAITCLKTFHRAAPASGLLGTGYPTALNAKQKRLAKELYCNMAVRQACVRAGHAS